MEYKLLFSDLLDPLTLETLVNQAILEGWIPNGSPTLYGSDGVVLVQSLIRKKDNASIFNSLKKGTTP